MPIGASPEADAQALRSIVRRRNRAEYLAGVFVIAFFAVNGWWQQRPLSSVPIIVGVLLTLGVLALHTRANPVPDGWAQLAAWRRAEAGFLRSVATWYLTPVLAGMLATMLLTLGPRPVPLVIVAFVAALVAASILRANRKAAAELDAEAEAMTR